MHLMLLLSSFQFCVYVFCIVAYEIALRLNPHCIELLALYFEMVFERSQNMVLII